MGLLQNISLLSAQPIRNTGGAAIQCVIRSSYNRPEQNINMFVSAAGIDQKSGVPNGYCPPYQFVMPIKDGGMSAYRNGIKGDGSVDSTSALTMGKSCTATLEGIGLIDSPPLTLLIRLIADISGSSDVAATMIGNAILSAELAGNGSIDFAHLTLLIRLLGELAGNGTLTGNMAGIATLIGELTGEGSADSASLSLLVQLVAELAGSGTITATMFGIAILAAELAGQGDLTGTINLIAWMITELTGEGDIDADLRGKLTMSATITSVGDVVTAASCAAAVWASLIESGLTSKEAMRLLAAIAVGKTDIQDLGGGQSIVKFRDTNDTKDRVTAEMDGSERIDVTLNKT